MTKIPITKIDSDSNDRSYYCSMKFRYLKVDLESSMTYNCHAASPHPVNLDLLKSSPGNLFNTDINVSERQQMLCNERNASCEQNCWRAEDVGAISPRLYQGGEFITHIEPVTNPEIIDLTINGDCNLTCTYCCKEFSSAWRRDIETAPYKLSNYTDKRYQLIPKDRALLNISQPKLKQNPKYQAILNELTYHTSELKKLTITGGEPFLDNQLVSMIRNANLYHGAYVEIYTGLGVSTNRFKNIIAELETLPYSICIIVSGETTGKYLEFNRYGISWNDFVERIDIVRSSKLQLAIQSTLSNLTVLDFCNFYNQFKDIDINLTFAYQPTMMAPYILDDESKRIITDNIQTLPEVFKLMIADSIAPTPTEQQKINIKEFLLEFASRRPDLSLGIFPESFLTWLGIDCVV